MGANLKLYGVALTVFLVLDIPWIGGFANGFYRSRLGHVLAETPNLGAAVLFYLIFVAGLVFFAVRPGMRRYGTGVLNSAVYGLMTYGTYDLTNLALIRDWPLSVTIIDMLWGISVSVAVAVISIRVGKRFFVHQS